MSAATLTGTVAGPVVVRERTVPEAYRDRHMVKHVLGIWVVSRIAVALVSFIGSYSSLDRLRSSDPNFLTMWNRWDVQLFAKVAHWGYFAQGVHYPDQYIWAFFPGEPIVLRLMHYVIPTWIGDGLILSFLAGGVASVMLAKLVLLETGSHTAGRNSVIFLVTSPFALFLFAGYSEALFLALAVSGWYCARKHLWLVAGLLIGYAAAVRITGLFLGIAFVVEYVVSRHRSKERIVSPHALPLLFPFAAIGLYFTYLHSKLGDWNAWEHAQKYGWYRQLTNPIVSLTRTWGYAFQGTLNTDLTLSFFADTVWVFLGLAIVAVLLWKRRWSHATYVFVGIASLATSTYYFSVSRSALTWFPMWMLLSEWSIRRRWLMPTWVMICAPMMAAYVVSFTNSRWVN